MLEYSPEQEPRLAKCGSRTEYPDRPKRRLQGYEAATQAARFLTMHLLSHATLENSAVFDPFIPRRIPGDLAMHSTLFFFTPHPQLRRTAEAAFLPLQG
jgi:hypothetical protein